MLHPLYFHGTDLVPNEQEAGCAPEPVWRLQRGRGGGEKIFFALPNIKKLIGHTAPTLATMPAEVSRGR